MDREEFAKLLSGREQWKSEEDVREGILGALKTLGLYFEVHEGIAQAGRVVLKFARRECFRGRGQGSTLANALAYLAGYVQKRARAEDCLAQEYLCVVTDGETMALAHMTGEGNMTQGSFVPLSHESFAMLPAVCRAGGRRSFTVENLILDFGPGSRNATRLMQALAKALSRYLECEGKNRVWTIFEDWKALYGKVADLSATQIGSILKETGFCYRAKKSASRGLPCAGIPLCRDRWRNNGPRAHDRGREHDSGVVCAALP